MIANAIAVSEPSSPARGTRLRTQPQIGAQASLKIPEASSIVSPRNHACRAASAAASPRPSAAWNEGPMIRITEPNVLGVSSPRGMAVTSDRPVRRAGNHPPEYVIPRHPEPDQQAGHQDHAADVVDHQPEECVDIAPADPLVGAGM